jgi:hypothetical protein
MTRVLATVAALLTAALVIALVHRPGAKLVRPVVDTAIPTDIKTIGALRSEAHRLTRLRALMQKRLEQRRRALHWQRRSVHRLRERLAPVTIAERYLGVPYVWGGATPAGFDCSGLVRYVFGKIGISLPHLAAAQMQMGRPVSTSAVEPGDLVFYEGGGHVAIYVGHGEVIHAPHTGDVVKFSPARMMPISAVRRIA